MKKILLDTNAYAAFKRGDEEAVEILRYAGTIGLSPIVLGELLCGFAAGQRVAQNRRELNAFMESPRVEVIPVDEGTAEYYSHVYKGLKQKGRPIPTNDLWIAATALQHGTVVYTYDKHFFEVDGLIVGQQLSDFLP